MLLSLLYRNETQRFRTLSCSVPSEFMLCKTSSSCLRKRAAIFPFRYPKSRLSSLRGPVRHSVLPIPVGFHFFLRSVVVNSQRCPGNTGHAAAECPSSGRACTASDLATSSVMVMLSLRLLSIPIACPCWMAGTYVRMCKHFKARPESHEFHTLRSAQPSPDVGTAFRRVEYGVKV